MKRKLCSLGVLCAVAVALGASSGAAADKLTAEKILFEEKFTGKLEDGWSWVREDPQNWRLEDGDLVLRTPSGYLHAKYNNSRNVLLRELPKSEQPLAVEVYVESDPKVQFEHAGVVWYVDDDNYVSLFREMLGGHAELQMVTEKAGSPSFHVVKHDAQGVRMRLLIADGSIATQYKPALDADWKTVGQSKMPAEGAVRVGLMCGGAPQDAERYVRFSDFRIVEIAGGK